MQKGNPRELYNDPDNTFTAQFMGTPPMNVFSCDGKIQMGFRPERAELSRTENGKAVYRRKARIITCEMLGSETVYKVETWDGIMMVKSRECEFEAGEECHLSVPDEFVLFFDGEGQRIRLEIGENRELIFGESEVSIMDEERKRRNRRKKWKDWLGSWLMILPALCFLLVFTIYPMLNIVRLSFFKGNALKPLKQFVGLDNYRQLFFVKTDFLTVLKNTGYYTMMVVVILLTLALLFALWMRADRKINEVSQVPIFTPHLIASISRAFIWTWLYNKNAYGLFNTVLGWFHIPCSALCWWLS